MPRDDDVQSLLESVAAPLGSMIAAVGQGVADAQRAMDQSTIDGYRALDRGDHPELQAIDYRPPWYRIPEVDAEMSVSLTLNATGQGRGGLGLYAMSHDATTTNRYQLDARAAAQIRFKIVAVPPSPEAASLRHVPRTIVGSTGVAAVSALDAQGISWELAEPDGTRDLHALVIQTSPEPGEIIGPDQTLRLWLGSSRGAGE